MITIPPWDTDGNTASFSTAELADIVSMWRSVAEDYAPFNLDVTTMQPNASVPVTNYVPVHIGGDGAWYGRSSGGISYLNTFGKNGSYQPSFVFPKNLGPDYPKVRDTLSVHFAYECCQAACTGMPCPTCDSQQHGTLLTS